jgi:hypothetical protein
VNQNFFAEQVAPNIRNVIFSNVANRNETLPINSDRMREKTIPIVERKIFLLNTILKIL